MKDIILRFKSQEDYEKFLEISQSQNQIYDDHTIEENDDKIIYLFEDSEVIEKRMMETSGEKFRSDKI